MVISSRMVMPYLWSVFSRASTVWTTEYSCLEASIDAPCVSPNDILLIQKFLHNLLRDCKPFLFVRVYQQSMDQPGEIANPARGQFFFFFFNLTYSRWTSSLPSCMWSLRIFSSLPGSGLTISYDDAISALLQLVNQWLNFTYSRSHAFRYERKNTNPTLVRIELTTSALAGVQVTY